MDWVEMSERELRRAEVLASVAAGRVTMTAAAGLIWRQGRLAAIVADLFKLWKAELSRILGKSKLAEATRYTTSRHEILERFFLAGRVRDRLEHC